MSRITTCLAVLVAFAAPLCAQQGAAGEAASPVVVMSGEATVVRTPDLAFVTLAVESRARSPRDAQRQNADAMASVQKQLTALAIPKDALRTLGLQLDQEFDNVEGRRVPRDFVARNTLEVRVNEVARAGEIVDAAVQAGATSLSGVRFDLKDRSGAEREALRLAVADARGRAEAAAAGAGRAIDRILKIEDAHAEGPTPRLMAGFARSAAAVTGVEPGLIEVRAQVVLTVSMK